MGIAGEDGEERTWALPKNVCSTLLGVVPCSKSGERDIQLGNDDYLTIQETASKIGMPTSWITEQICDGKLSATLSGRQWLISPRDVERLHLTVSASQKQDVVHNPQTKRSKKQPATRGDSKPASPARKGSVVASKNLSSSKVRTEATFTQGTTLTQRIKALDREFDLLSANLTRVMQAHEKSGGKTGGSNTRNPGNKVARPKKLIHKWRTKKAELQRLVELAESKGLSLPRNLYIYEVLDRERRATERQSRPIARTRPKKPAVPVKGIEGYYAGPSGPNPTDSRKIPADVEAKLIVLRHRARAAAHDMRDRGKSLDARNVAADRWAQARLDAERLEREFGLGRKRD